MRILLLGEYSRLHNSLKEGLTALGHEVIIVGSGDGFKNYPADFSIKAQWCETKLLNIPRQIIHRIFKFDIAKWENGLRFYFLLPKLKGFDVVQLINERPIQTTANLEYRLLKQVVQNNKNTFLLCCGIDYFVMQHMLLKKEHYSILNPYFEGNPEAKKEIAFVFDYNTKAHLKIHNYLYKNIKGVIASDIDYINPIKNNSKYLGLIPNPINTAKLEFIENPINDKVVIFLGINTLNYFMKGIPFFEKALVIIQEKQAAKVEIIITKNVPYDCYIEEYNRAHIILDQVYAYDQGYNALEAMAKGKVVFTGAEKEFLTYYNLQEDEVAVNALPDVDYLVKKLTFFIENPNELKALEKRAKAFIKKEHDYIKTAQQYLDSWNKN